jgi:hypothetical protein
MSPKRWSRFLYLPGQLGDEMTGTDFIYLPKQLDVDALRSIGAFT